MTSVTGRRAQAGNGNGAARNPFVSQNPLATDLLLKSALPIWMRTLLKVAKIESVDRGRAL